MEISGLFAVILLSIAIGTNNWIFTEEKIDYERLKSEYYEVEKQIRHGSLPSHIKVRSGLWKKCIFHRIIGKNCAVGCQNTSAVCFIDSFFKD